MASRVVLRRGTIPAAYGLPHLHTIARPADTYTARSVLLSLSSAFRACSLSHPVGRAAMNARLCTRSHTTETPATHLPFPESPHWHPSWRLARLAFGSLPSSLRLQGWNRGAHNCVAGKVMLFFLSLIKMFSKDPPVASGRCRESRDATLVRIKYV